MLTSKEFNEWADNAVGYVSGAIVATLAYSLTSSWQAVWIGIAAVVLAGFLRQVYLWRKANHTPTNYYDLQD